MSERQTAESDACACGPDECLNAGTKGCYFGEAPTAENGLRLDPFYRACCHWQGVYDESEPEPDGSAVLHDHFSATVELRIAEIQPQYGLVQLNAMRRACGCLVSCDVNRDAFLAVVASVLNVTITDAEGRVLPPALSKEEGR